MGPQLAKLLAKLSLQGLVEALLCPTSDPHGGLNSLDLQGVGSAGGT